MWDGTPTDKGLGGQETKTAHAPGARLGFRSDQFALF
jgi:hypothetical protein